MRNVCFYKNLLRSASRRSYQAYYRCMSSPTYNAIGPNVCFPKEPLGRQRRGAKSKATVSIEELSGSRPSLERSLRDNENDGPAYPTVVQQARENMRRFDNCVLLTRVGSFYEVQNHKVYALLGSRKLSSTLNMQKNMGHY